MNSFEDIQVIWKAAENDPVPDVKTVIETARKETVHLRNKIIIEGGLLCLAIVTILYVCFTFHFRYPTTYIGLAIMLITVTFFTTMRLRLALRLQELNFSLPPILIIKKFNTFHKAQQFLHTTVYAYYVLLLNIAFALYFYEVIFHSSLHNTWQILAVCIYLVWMLISVFYITPKNTKKENNRVRSILKRLQQSEKILNEEPD